MGVKRATSVRRGIVVPWPGRLDSARPGGDLRLRSGRRRGLPVTDQARDRNETVRTNRLFVLAVITALVGLVPWAAAAPLMLKIFGSLLTLICLLIAYLTGSVLITGRGAKPKSGCGACTTCSCSSGSSADTSSTPASA